MRSVLVFACAVSATAAMTSFIGCTENFSCEGEGYEVGTTPVLDSEQFTRPGAKVVVTGEGAEMLATDFETLVRSFLDQPGGGPIDLSEVANAAAENLDFAGITVEDLGLNLDLSQGSGPVATFESPANLVIEIDRFALGVEGTVIEDGSVSSFACRIRGNLNSNRTMFIIENFRIDLRFRETDGRFDVQVADLDFDIVDTGIDVVADEGDPDYYCNFEVCQDGVSGCSECVLACGGASLLEDVFGFFTEFLDAIIATVTESLTDQILGNASVIEGEVHPALLVGSLIPDMIDSHRIAFGAHPSRDGFAVGQTASGDYLTSSFDLAVVPSQVHTCAGAGSLVPVVSPPKTLGQINPQPGEHLITALPAATLNQALWALYSAGALCLEITSDDIANLSAQVEGGIALDATAMSLFLPGLDVVVDKGAPLMISVGVPLDPAQPDVITIGTGAMGADGQRDSLIRTSLRQFEIGVYAWIEGRYVRLLAVTTDIDLALTPLLNPDGVVNVALDKADISNVEVTYNELFISADLQSLISFVVEIGVGALLGDGLEFPISPSALIEAATGLPLRVEPTSFRQAGNYGDWISLGVKLAVSELKSRSWPSPRWVDTAAEGPTAVEAGHPIALTVAAQDASGPLDRDAYDVETRVDGGVWRVQPPGDDILHSALLGLLGRHVVMVRARRHDDPLAVDQTPQRLEVRVMPPRDVTAEGSEEPSANHTSACSVASVAGSAPEGWALVLMAALGLLLARRRDLRMALVLLALGAIVGMSGCGDDPPTAQRVACGQDRDCPAGQLCACDGYCFAPRTCSSDAGCCAGEVCADGWCEEVRECTTSADCSDGQSCGGCLCRLPRCLHDSDCDGGAECVAGACITPPEFPCPLGCPETQVCVAELRRCAPVPPGCAEMSCPSGEVLVVSDAKSFIGAACQPASAACTCEPAVFGVLSGEPSGYLSAVPLADGRAAVAAYDLATGDIAVRWLSDGALSDPTYIDGLPAPIMTASMEERAALAPGPDIGAELDMAVNEGGTLAIASSNRSDGALRLTWSQEGVDWVGVNLALADRGVRYPDIEPIPGGGWMVAFQSLSQSGAGVNTALRILQIDSVGPTAPTNAPSTVVEVPVEGDPSFTPAGTGVTPSLLHDGPRWYLTFQDAEAGTLEMATWTSLSNVDVVTVLTPETRGAISGGSTGLGARTWIDASGELHSVFIDVTSGELRSAQWTYDSDTNTITDLRQQLVDLGGSDSPQRFLASDTAVTQIEDTTVIAYQDVTNGDLYAATSSAAGWSRERVSSVGFVGFYPQLVTFDDRSAVLLHGEWTFPSAGRIEQHVRVESHSF